MRLLLKNPGDAFLQIQADIFFQFNISFLSLSLKYKSTGGKVPKLSLEAFISVSDKLRSRGHSSKDFKSRLLQSANIRFKLTNF